jgi:GGDEF domain-containing protein
MDIALALWRSSTAVQVSSLAIIAVFFAVLRKSVRTGELRYRVFGWIADFTALAVSFSVGIAALEPGGEPEEAVKAADELTYRAKPLRLRTRAPGAAAASGLA